jgi:hypothetical protein
VLRRLTAGVAAIALVLVSLFVSSPCGWVAITIKDPDCLAFVPKSRSEGWNFREDRRERVGELAARRLVTYQAVFTDRVARNRDAYGARVQDRGSHVAEDDPQRCVSTLAPSWACNVDPRGRLAVDLASADGPVEKVLETPRQRAGVFRRAEDNCDAVLRRPGESTGADQDVAIARERGLPVFFALDEIPAREVNQ